MHYRDHRPVPSRQNPSPLVVLLCTSLCVQDYRALYSTPQLRGADLICIGECQESLLGAEAPARDVQQEPPPACRAPVPASQAVTSSASVISIKRCLQTTVSDPVGLSLVAVESVLGSGWWLWWGRERPLQGRGLELQSCSRGSPLPRLCCSGSTAALLFVSRAPPVPWQRALPWLHTPAEEGLFPGGLHSRGTAGRPSQRCQG